MKKIKVDIMDMINSSKAADAVLDSYKKIYSGTDNAARRAICIHSMCSEFRSKHFYYESFPEYVEAKNNIKLKGFLDFNKRNNYHNIHGKLLLGYEELFASITPDYSEYADNAAKCINEKVESSNSDSDDYLYKVANEELANVIDRYNDNNKENKINRSDDPYPDYAAEEQ